MKKNLKYNVLNSVIYVNSNGLASYIDEKVQFIRGELIHEARRVEIFNENKKPVVLLTNNFDFSIEDISEIYRLRWAIESLSCFRHALPKSRLTQSSTSRYSSACSSSMPSITLVGRVWPGLV